MLQNGNSTSSTPIFLCGVTIPLFPGFDTSVSPLSLVLYLTNHQVVDAVILSLHNVSYTHPFFILNIITGTGQHFFFVCFDLWSLSCSNCLVVSLLSFSFSLPPFLKSLLLKLPKVHFNYKVQLVYLRCRDTSRI